MPPEGDTQPYVDPKVRALTEILVVRSAGQPVWDNLTPEMKLYVYQGYEQYLTEAGFDVRKTKMNTSERALYVTRLVMDWITNDGDHIDEARSLPTMQSLAAFLTRTLSRANWNTPAWHCAQELANNDYERVNWDIVWDSLHSNDVETKETPE